MSLHHDHLLAMSVEGLYKQFGVKKVLHDVNIEIAAGQIVSLVGPSGCGKSTLLNSILGTLLPTAGAVSIIDAKGARHLVQEPGRDRGIVYQRYSLYPFLTAQENVAIGPKLDETSLPFRLFRPLAWRELRRTHFDQAAALLKKVGLGDAIHRYPHELSGGMRQRVAIAQALIMKPRILLLDEPFGALDEATREDLQTMLLRFYEDNIAAKRAGQDPPYTILIVTHELNEAIYVADRVLGLSQYWDWKEAGYEAAPGATVIYDKAAPIYKSTDLKEYERFVAQREEIRQIVFEQAPLPRLGEHVAFWENLDPASTEGVLGG